MIRLLNKTMTLIVLTFIPMLIFAQTEDSLTSNLDTKVVINKESLTKSLWIPETSGKMASFMFYSDGKYKMGYPKKPSKLSSVKYKWQWSEDAINMIDVTCMGVEMIYKINYLDDEKLIIEVVKAPKRGKTPKGPLVYYANKK
jgi:hypothetical protein